MLSIEEKECGIEIANDWWNLYVGNGNIKETIHVNCRKSVDFISVKIQVVAVDSWKKWLNFVFCMCDDWIYKKKKYLQKFSVMIWEMGMLSCMLSLSLSGISLWGNIIILLVFEKWAKSAQHKVTMAPVN